MSEMRATGRPVSTGLHAGPIALLTRNELSKRAQGSPAQEEAALKRAIDLALGQLIRLAANIPGDGADILGFQIAMLEDNELALPAFAAIGIGVGAEAAWEAALATQIADYSDAGDEHFRARASDIGDIRDRVVSALSGAVGESPVIPGAIVLGEDMTPSRFLAIDWAEGGGIALTAGSASGHLATLARARSIPMVVRIDLDPGTLNGRAEALIDGDLGTLCLDPSPQSRVVFAARQAEARRASEAAEAYRTRPAATADGTPIAVFLNIADPAEVDALDSGSCDGIGLVRTEFLFHARDDLPDEERQYRVYRRLAEWANGKPVTIRTLDAGADKPIPGLTIDNETNPFLGVRGIRLSLAKPAPFRVQLRALARAASHGAVEVMLPMVALPSELDLARRYLEEEVAALTESRVACRSPKLGIMVEVPAAAIMIDQFDAAFFSIGSNDLTQYVMAAARDNHAVAEINDAGGPAVLRLVAQVAAHGVATGKKVSLCGDAGGDSRHIGPLLKAGLRAVSVAPSALARTKQAIARVHLGETDR
jgi:phosphoenolpyruvate-protein phosphotransferase (PTS system enzyme I)